MTKMSVSKRALLRLSVLTVIVFLAGCSDTNKIAPKDKDKDISAEERQSKRGQ